MREVKEPPSPTPFLLFTIAVMLALFMFGRETLSRSFYVSMNVLISASSLYAAWYADSYDGNRFLAWVFLTIALFFNPVLPGPELISKERGPNLSYWGTVLHGIPTAFFVAFPLGKLGR